MSSIEKSAGGRAATDSAAQSGSSSPAVDRAVNDELACLEETSTAVEALSFMLRYAQDSRRVFERLSDAAAGNASVRAALEQACPDWRNPEAVSGFEAAAAWLAAELHTHACCVADSLRTIDQLRGAA